MQCLQNEYPDHSVYVMSGNDEYYNKIGAIKEGSIFLLQCAERLETIILMAV